MTTKVFISELFTQIFWWQNQNPVAMYEALKLGQVSRYILRWRIAISLAISLLPFSCFFIFSYSLAKTIFTVAMILFGMQAMLFVLPMMLLQEWRFASHYLFSPLWLSSTVLIAIIMALTPLPLSLFLSIGILLPLLVAVSATDIIRVILHAYANTKDRETTIRSRRFHSLLITTYFRLHTFQWVAGFCVLITAMLLIVPNRLLACALGFIAIGFWRIDATLWALLSPAQPKQKTVGYALRHALFLPTNILDQVLNHSTPLNQAQWLLTLATNSLLVPALLGRLKHREDFLPVCEALSTLPGSLDLLQKARKLAKPINQEKLEALIALTTEAEKPLEQQLWLHRCSRLALDSCDILSPVLLALHKPGKSPLLNSAIDQLSSLLPAYQYRNDHSWPNAIILHLRASRCYSQQHSQRCLA